MTWKPRRIVRRQIRHEPPEVDITAFMSLMVILIPFLLITAVFSRIAIIELDIGSGEPSQIADRDPLELQIRVRERSIAVSYRGDERSLSVERTETGSDLAWLTEHAAGLKAKFPSSTQATILFEPQVRFEIIVRVMDAVRWRKLVDGEEIDAAELFSDLSLGPLASGASHTGGNP